MRYMPDFDSRDFVKSTQNKIQMGIESSDLFSYDSNSDETDYGFGGGTYPNLLDAHPPFQIDGNFGATSGVSLMLLQSTMDSIDILPALPDTWSEGNFTGFLAKGGINVSAWWKDSKAYKLVLSTDEAKSVSVKVNGEILSIKLEIGENLIEL